MSSYLYASSTAQSLNGEEYQIRIIENTSGTDSTKEFDVGPSGVKLTYENTDDTLLLPGIVHSRCEVQTLWPSGSTTLTTLINNLLSAQDGDWLIEVLRDDTRIWVGTILCEQVDLMETTPLQSLRIVATDGLSLLRDVPYNDDGTAYTDTQILFDEILPNIQEKWTTWSYLDDQNTDEVRLEIADDVYSTDDYVMALTSHPGGTGYYNTRRMKIHTHAFSHTDASNNTSFISTYDLLQSICLTLQLRLYYYGDTWSFIPAYLSDEEILGYRMSYGGTITSANITGTSNFQVDTLNNVRQKGAEWVQSFTPQINNVRLERDTNKGYEIIQSFDVANGVEQSQDTLTFAGSGTAAEDDAYMLRFTAYIENTALTRSESERLGRIVFKFTIQFDTGASATYYKNDIVPSPAGRLQQHTLDLDGDFNSQDYAALSFPEIGYSSTVGRYHYHRDDAHSYYYDFNTAGQRYLEGGINIPPPPTARTGISIVPTIEAWDSFGNYDAAATAALDTKKFTFFAFVAYSNNQLAVVPNFTWSASTNFGRGSVDLGKTHIGGLGVGMGSILVQINVDGTYSTTDNWVNQADANERPINELCVEEVLAAHYRSRKVERGSIVYRGTGATPGKPFSRYYDNDTGEYYSALNWQLIATACEIELTLRKIGRNALSITTEAVDTGDPLRGPVDTTQGQPSSRPTNIMYSYNTQARNNYAGDWSSVIGSETKEMYYTIGNDGQGTYLNGQGQVPDTPGATIVRKIYVNTKGLQQRTDTGWLSPAALQPADNDSIETCFELIRNYIAKVDDHGAYTFMVTYDEVSTLPLLNTYTGGTAAYSLRKLNSSYTGSAINVRRTGTNPASQDIGFTASGELDTAAIVAFCQFNDGFVQTWYDQSGNGRNATQSTTTLQPQIYDSAGVFTVNGKPAVYFDGDYLDTAAFAPNPSGKVNAAAVVQFDGITTRQSAASQWGSTSGQQNFFFQMQEVVVGLRFGWRYSGNTLTYVDQIATATADTQYLMSGKFEQSAATVLYDGVAGSVTNAPSGSQTPNNHSRVMRLGGLSTNTTQLMSGYIQEFVIWSNTTAHSETNISDDINDHYSVF